MRPTEPVAPAAHAIVDAPAPAVLLARGAGGASGRIGCGTVGRIGFQDVATRARFVELAAIAPRPRPAVLDAAGERWMLDFHVDPGAVAVVTAGAEAVGGQRVRDCLELAAATARRGHRAVARCLADHAMAGLADLPVRSLQPQQHVQVQFLQAWLREPEWLLFDGVFDAPAPPVLSQLPQRFADRFPMRTLSFLGRSMPQVDGMPQAPVLNF